MPGRRAIVIAVDGLRASALGAYGNSWHPTPALDALAAQSLVADWLFCNGPTLADFYHAAWGLDQEWLNRAAAAGVSCSLVTDATDLPGAELFAETLLVATDADEPAADISQTGFASVLAVAAEQIATWVQASDAGDKLLWVHMRGFMGPWDAPQDLRAGLVDEDDPEPQNFVTPPEHVATMDQDALLGYRAAYGAQMIVLDECVGGLMAALAELGLDQTALIVIVGCRGYALGEHGAVGSGVGSLFGETLHVPCMLRVPGELTPPPRHADLAQVADVTSTLGAWFGLKRIEGSGVDLLASRDVAAVPGQVVIACGAHGEMALRTPAWLLRLPPRAEDPTQNDRPSRAELYVKPDDRWEANEIGDRCGSVAERLLAVLERHQHRDASTPVQPLDADLVEPGR